MAVSFRFFSDQHNPPEIYSLVKYYLDLLKGPVFKDDRQVYYLDASIWRSAPKEQYTTSRLYIRARRLREYLQILDLCRESEDFNKRNDTHIVFHHLIDNSLCNDAERQFSFLRSNRIMPYDIPRLNNPFLVSLVKDFSTYHPLIFDFGSLHNKHGQSQYFQKVISSSLSGFVTSYPIFKQILVPIEFDVQVTKAGLKLTKDLDNIMITICGEVRKQLLHKNAYVNGYRVYVVDKLESDIDSGIQVKLLPPGEIESYNERIEKALETLEDNL
jgi:hypothetical protein